MTQEQRNSEEQKYKHFWNPSNMDEARKLILDSPDWDHFSSAVIQHIFSFEVMKRIPMEASALEIGAGVGRLMKFLRDNNLVAKVTGLDISPGMVVMSKPYLRGVENAEVVLCDGKTFPVESNSVDFVYSVICFQHIPWREMVQKYIAESYRVLRPGGVIRIQTHVGNGDEKFHGMIGCFYPSSDAFEGEFIDAGFEVVEANRGEGHPDYLWVTGVK